MESGTGELSEMIEEPLCVEDGYVTVPDRPGIGVELREEALSDFPVRTFAIAPARRADGAIAH